MCRIQTPEVLFSGLWLVVPLWALDVVGLSDPVSWFPVNLVAEVSQTSRCVRGRAGKLLS
jgi:hypothetical protein